MTGKPVPAIGIDLGTTFSLLAYLDPSGRPTTIANRLGDLLTPSAVLVDGNDLIVGKEAIRGSVLSPQTYAECFKRDMGAERYSQPLNGHIVPPEVLSALVLERLKLDASDRLGDVKQVVITVPAYFDETRRRATQEAARLAGLEVLDILNEPTAAALAYGYSQGTFSASGGQNTRVERMVVFDLGGGTFDVTVLELQGNQFRALSTDGDVQLGGKDFDARLVDFLAAQLKTAHNVNVREQPDDYQQLQLDAQEAKEALTERHKTSLMIRSGAAKMRVEITREKFEELTRDLLERAETTTSLALAQANLQWSQIDRVLLIGGSSRMPMVAEMLLQLTGKTPDRTQSLDEAVAHGAALYCGSLLNKNGAAPSCKLINVNSHSLGVLGIQRQTKEHLNAIIIRKNTPLPHAAVKVFSTLTANQQSVRAVVVEGESERPDACTPVGEVVVRDLPADLPAGTKIEIHLRYQENGLLAVTARLPSIRRSAEVRVERKRGTLEPLEIWKARLISKPVGPAKQPLAKPAAAKAPVRAAAPQPQPVAMGSSIMSSKPQSPAAPQGSSILSRPAMPGPAGSSIMGTRSAAAGATAAPAATVDAIKVRQRFEEICGHLGRGALQWTLPLPGQAAQQAAWKAAQDWQVANAAVRQLEQQPALDPVRLAEGKEALRQAHVRAEIACRQLGRLCLDLPIQFPGLEKMAHEAHHLRQQLLTMGRGV